MTDILDQAMSTEYKPGVRVYFGQVQTDVWPCVLVKGQGKVPFDAGQHSPDDKRISITLTVACWSHNGGVYQVERSMIAESREWATIVKPSLQKLGMDLRRLNGAWVQAAEAPTGTKFTSTKTGEQIERTTLRFDAIYPDMNACHAAMTAYFAQHRTGQPETAEAPAATPTNGNGTSGDGDKATALKFLPALWKSCAGDVQKFERLLANTPMVAKHFQINSPEVLAVISGS